MCIRCEKWRSRGGRAPAPSLSLDLTQIWAKLRRPSLLGSSSLPPLIITALLLVMLIKILTNNYLRNTDYPSPAHKAVSELKTNVPLTMETISLLPFNSHSALRLLLHPLMLSMTLNVYLHLHQGFVKRKQSSKLKEREFDVKYEEMLLYRQPLTSFFWLTSGWWPATLPPGGAYSPCPRHPRLFHSTALWEARQDCSANMSVTSKFKKRFFDIDVGWLSQFSSSLCSFVGVIRTDSLLNEYLCILTLLW